MKFFNHIFGRWSIYIKERKLKADEKIKSKWELYASADYIPLKSYSPGTHLLNTTWGQSGIYQQSCPDDPISGEVSLAGCNAVALGQILNYWGCMVFPDGTETYTPDGFSSSITVNFYDQNYNWGNLSSDDIADLLYHCGVAVQSDYSEGSTTAFPSRAEYALENYFGFNTSGFTWETSSGWVNLLKTEIDAERPIFYVGDGHSWVIEGYKADNTFYCNWGWNGGSNAYYSLSDLTPDIHNFNSNQRAILGIEPILDACTETQLDGADLICSTNETYSVSIPSTASVVWSKSSNIDQVGGNTGTSYTVNSGTSGAGDVTATIKNSQGQTFLTRSKDVYVSTPYINPTTISFSNGSDAGSYHCTDCFGNTATVTLPCDYDYLDVKLTNLSGSQTISQFTVAGNSAGTVAITMGGTTPSAGQYMFWVRGTNDCGTGSWSKKAVTYQSCGGLGLLFSPNPTAGETTVSIETQSTEENYLKSAFTEPVYEDDIEWELEVYDTMQSLKTKKTKIRGKSTTLNTHNWKEGVYTVRVKYKGDVLTGKLVVKK